MPPKNAAAETMCPLAGDMPGLRNSMECAAIVRNECRGGELCRIERADIQHDGISALAGAARNQQCLKVDGVPDDRAATWGVRQSSACYVARPGVTGFKPSGTPVCEPQPEDHVSPL
jgi:hypothetical protein